MDISNNDTLAHYGVLGMHWGVRKREEQSTLSRRQRVRTVLDKKMQGPNAHKDERSKKTIALGRANTAATIGSLGAILLGFIDPEPVSKGALLVAGILGTIGAVTVAQLEERSAGNDLLKIYEK